MKCRHAFQSKFLTKRTWGHFRTKFTHGFCFCFFLKMFSFFSWTFIYATYKFSGKNGDIVSRSKFLIRRTQGHFRTKFTRRFFFFFFFFLLKNLLFVSWTSIFATYRISCKNGEIAFQSKFLTKRTMGAVLFKIDMSFFFLFFLTNFAFISSTSYRRTQGHFLTKITRDFFFFFKRIFPFVSWTSIYAI